MVLMLRLPAKLARLLAGLLLAVCLWLPGCAQVTIGSDLMDLSDPPPDATVRLTVRCVEGKCGYVDQNGNFAIPPAFKIAKPFYEGLASVYIEKQGWGAIDPAGIFVIPPKFAWIGPFSEGLAGAELDPKNLWSWAYIDHSGATVIPLKYDVERASPFHGGRAWVRCPFLFSTMSKEIDRNGRVIERVYPR